MGSDRVQSNADTFDVEDLAHPRKQNGQSKTAYYTAMNLEPFGSGLALAISRQE